MRHLIGLVLMFAVVGCVDGTTQDVPPPAPPPDVTVRLAMYDSELAPIDACAADLNLMDGNAYGRHVVRCDDGIAVYTIPRWKLPLGVYFLDGNTLIQGPMFELVPDEDVQRLAIRVPAGWTSGY